MPTGGGDIPIHATASEIHVVFGFVRASNPAFMGLRSAAIHSDLDGTLGLRMCIPPAVFVFAVVLI